MMSKKCDLCGSKAEVFLTQVFAGEKTSMNLCTDHAVCFDLDKLQTYDIIPQTNRGRRAAQGPRCPHCGMNEALFQRKGRLGCEHCYESLSELVRPHLKNLHVGTEHVGKIPTGFSDPRIFQNRLTHLYDQLEKAVASERYEEAAEYRDVIEGLSQNEKS